MYALILFIVICVIQYGFYRWKKSEVDEYQSVATGIADFSGASKKILYKRSVIFLSNMINLAKNWLWPLLLILLVVNFLLALIIGTLTHLIVNLF